MPHLFRTVMVTIVGLLMSIQIMAQSNLTISPEQPSPGQTITITYTPSESMIATAEPIHLIYYRFQPPADQFAMDGQFTKSGKTLVATIKTDTADVLVGLKIFNDKGSDNNNNEGFIIPLYKDGKEVAGSKFMQGMFYSFFASQFDLQKDSEKELDLMDEDLEEYPEDSKYIVNYLGAYKSVHPDTFDSFLQKQIEKTLAEGLKTEGDYTNLATMYELGNLAQQSKWVNEMALQKFPNGRLAVQNKIRKYSREADQTKKETMWAAISDSIDNSPNWKFLKDAKGYYQSQLIQKALRDKNWTEVDKIVKKYNIQGSYLASNYNSIAWDLQEKDQDLQEAEKLSAQATNWAKDQINNPTEPKPDYLTESQARINAGRTYGNYADTYAHILYKLGKYKEANEYATDAAIKYGKSNDPDLNGTYAMTASKVLKAKKYIPSLEQMVRDGKSNEEVKKVLKTNYIKKHSEEQYVAYMNKLEEAGNAKMRTELAQKMLDQESPEFSLKDLNGKEVSTDDLKGKVVVVDFWATWCGPCISSFPAMQKTIDKYKNDKNVVFLFVNTWETVDNKEKNASDFITENKYPFHVLMDVNNYVITKFGVSGIPTKFIIDGNGKIRFRSVGWSGNVDGFVKELSTMIDLSKG